MKPCSRQLGLEQEDFRCDVRLRQPYFFDRVSMKRFDAALNEGVGLKWAKGTAAVLVAASMSCPACPAWA